MKLVSQALADKNLKLKDLSQDLKQRIDNHREMILKYNMACEEYEGSEDEDSEVEKKLDEQEDFIANNEKELVAEIKNYQEPASASAAASAAPAAPASPAKSKDNSVGWLIFGGAVLLVTLGAVNVFKKK